jgi:hypothetical protein
MMADPNQPNSAPEPSGKSVAPLEYRRPTERNPRLSPEAAKYEREGWIGLIVTLVICTVAFILWMIFHKATDSF